MGLVEDLVQLDDKLSQYIAHLIPFESNMRKIIQGFTFTGTAFFWVAYFIGWYVFQLTRVEELLSMVFVFLFMLIPVYFLKHTIKRPRPDYKDTRMGVVAMDKWSFPSGHASRSTYVMILMPIYIPSFTIFWILWGLALIATRLLLGVHFVSDILGGIVVTAATLSLLFLVDFLPIIPWI